MVLSLDEFFRANHTVAVEDVKSGKLSFDCLPVRMVLLFHARVVQGVAWHQVLVAILIPYIVSLADSVCAAQLKLEDLLGWSLVERI